MAEAANLDIYWTIFLMVCRATEPVCRALRHRQANTAPAPGDAVALYGMSAAEALALRHVAPSRPGADFLSQIGF